LARARHHRERLLRAANQCGGVPRGHFAAAILRARSSVANLGAIGTIMGHEITHAFDAAGRLYDSLGKLNDSWSTETAEAFDARTQCLVDQYSNLEGVPDHKVNGTLTLAENIADLGGVLLAHDLLEADFVRDDSRQGFSSEQQFFLAFAQNYCSNERAEYAIRLLGVDPHSPHSVRVDATLANVPAFAEAFACRAGDPMVRAEPCSVW
jgi:putative endopeptidase